MNRSPFKFWLKSALGSVPGLAEKYQDWVGQSPYGNTYRLDQLLETLPRWRQAAADAALQPDENPRRILLVAYLRWWLEYDVALGMMLDAVGHHIDMGLIPYYRWTRPLTSFDTHRRQHYVRQMLSEQSVPFKILDLYRGGVDALPVDLEASMQEQSVLDVQYTLQREDIDPLGEHHELYQLRLERNRAAARAAYGLLQSEHFDTVIIPNGSILEFGAIYRTARYVQVPVVTYEFGEQRQRMWLAQDGEVMRLDTTVLWKAKGNQPLNNEEREKIETLYQARRGARTWGQFKRQWQANPSQGAQQAAEKLGLNPERPMVLLCTNVVGDSLALNRQVFTQGMSDWLEVTVKHFAERPQAQLVVRVHPGELLGAGHPSVDIVRQALPQLPEHVIVVPPEDNINTYDLFELTHFGLTYTTTVGMEMAMFGVPVIVSGATHYRHKGFTVDPDTLDGYLAAIDNWLDHPEQCTIDSRQSQLAWRYAYRFFFELPFAFPWHLVTFWEDLEQRPFESVMTAESLAPYRETLKALSGQPIDWKSRKAVQV
ncbi:MAG: hypothetical protein PVF49_04975 [Anaerolineales bacterium]|jgi:hypothetical protein